MLLERHLRRCTRCAVEVAQIRALRVLLRRPDIEIPPTLLQRLIDVAPPRPSSPPAEPTGPRSPRRSVDSTGLVMAAVLLLVAVGIGVVVPGAGVALPPAARASLTGVLPADWVTGSRDAVIVPAVDNDPSP